MSELREYIIKKHLYEMQREKKLRKKEIKERNELPSIIYDKLSEMLEVMEFHGELLLEVKDHPKKIRDLQQKIKTLKNELWETMGTKSKNEKFKNLYKKFKESEVKGKESDGSEFKKKKG